MPITIILFMIVVVSIVLQWSFNNYVVKELEEIKWLNKRIDRQNRKVSALEDHFDLCYNDEETLPAKYQKNK